MACNCMATTVFSGADPGGGAVVGPNSLAAQTTFTGLLSGFGTDTLEGATLNLITGSIGSAFGVTITADCTDNTSAHTCDSAFTGVKNSGNSQFGFNTTASGANFYQVAGGVTSVTLPSVLKLTFSSPIQAFGAYFTGIEATLGPTVVSFNDGSAESFSLLDTNSGGVAGSQFFGFTTSGFVSEIDFTTSNIAPNRDIWGVDDIIIGNVSSVPEPSTIALLAMPLLALALYKWKTASSSASSAPAKK